MRITNEYIKSLNPCFERHLNYLEYYKDTDLSIVEFLQLEHITYDDKIWVWRYFTTKDEAVLFALKCADSVLYIFEDRYPKDNRPRMALNTVREYIKDPSLENQNKCNAAYAYAYAVCAVTYASAATPAAYDAAYAAAYAASKAASYADANTASNAAVYAAAYTVAYTDTTAARKAQQDKNIKFLIEIYEGK